jgi:hypothetical protein
MLSGKYPIDVWHDSDQCSSKVNEIATGDCRKIGVDGTQTTCMRSWVLATTGALRKSREGQISEVSLDFRSVIDVFPRKTRVRIHLEKDSRCNFGIRAKGIGPAQPRRGLGVKLQTAMHPAWDLRSQIIGHAAAIDSIPHLLLLGCDRSDLR